MQRYYFDDEEEFGGLPILLHRSSGGQQHAPEREPREHHVPYRPPLRTD